MIIKLFAQRLLSLILTNFNKVRKMREMWIGKVKFVRGKKVQPKENHVSSGREFKSQHRILDGHFSH